MKRLIAIAFLLSAVSQLSAQKASVEEIFDHAAPITPQELAKQRPSREQRYAVKCVVMFQRLDDIFMAHGGGINFILTPRRASGWPAALAPVRLRAGDEVEISGLLLFTKDILQMTDVVFRVIGRDRPVPAPISLNEADLPTAPHRCDLVRLTAPLNYLIKSRSNSHLQTRFFLGEDGKIVAIVGTKEPLSREHISDGYMLEVTGYLTKQGDGQSYLWMRTPEDIRVLGPGPAIQRQRQWQWGTVGSLAAAAIALWIVLLRRQVRLQTSALTQANARLQASKTDLIANLAREKEVNDLKSSFVSMVSHEFRTPLAVILSSTELLRNHSARLSEDKQRTQMDNIIQSTQIMSGMIEEVLVLGKVEDGRMTCTPVLLDLADFAAVLVDEGLSATMHRCPIRLQITDLQEQAVADPALLRHIFSNLLSNAVKYSPEGSPVDFTLSRQGSDVVCIIRDRGIGIPEADLTRLFQAFHRAGNVGQRSGTGLGLVIVKRCVDLHGGSIQIESLEHAGTTVTVSLPVFNQTYRRS
jgi:signal transduction histidine kinase